MARLPQPLKQAQESTDGALREKEVSELWHGLTAKQQSWLLEYLSNGLNATQAVKDSEYETDSANGCHTLGYENRHHPKIRPLIQHAIGHHMTDAEVLKRVSQIARASWEDFLSFTDDGRVVPDLEKAKKRGKMHLIDQVKWDAEYDEERGEVVQYVQEIRLKDDQKAHDQLLKATGAYDLEAPAATVQNVTINQWNQDLNDHLRGEGDRWPEVKEIDEE